MRFVPARVQIYLWPQRLLHSVASNEPLAPPWPRLLVSIGRRSVPIALALKQVAKAFALHIQNPKVPKHRFDLIAAPVHDGYSGDNVINTFGAVHSVTAERLAGSVESFAAKIDPLPHTARRCAAWRRQRGLQLPARPRRFFRRVARPSHAR
jgi:mitochondrial fission protein ELM1